MEIRKINIPIEDGVKMSLKAGEKVLISGTIYTARDEAHEKIIEMFENGQHLPMDFKNQAIYYAGPAPAKPGEVIGSCGPTTSTRMDKYTPTFLKELGVSVMIGKGNRGSEVIEAIKNTKSVYFVMIGGLGAKIASCVTKNELIAFPELGAEAIRKLEVVDMPSIVAIDSAGHSIYSSMQASY